MADKRGQAYAYAKAAGGVRNYEDAVKMVEMGVTRIGTSSAKVIADGGESKSGY